MTYLKPKSRNFDKVANEDIRKSVDGQFNDMHDLLSDAYYNHWKFDESFPVNIGGTVYDKLSSFDETKALFDKLHGLIFTVQENALIAAGVEDLPIERNVVQEDGTTIKQVKTNKELNDAKIAELKLEGIEIK